MTAHYCPECGHEHLLASDARTPTTTVYLPDPANDETLTMSGYDWWRYRAAIEAEARAEPPRIVTLAWDATAEDVARIRRDWEAAAEPRAEGLDVERLARALDRLFIEKWPHVGDPMRHRPATTVFGAYAEDIAREYAALEEPTA